MGWDYMLIEVIYQGFLGWLCGFAINKNAITNHSMS